MVGWLGSVHHNQHLTKRSVLVGKISKFFSTRNASVLYCSVFFLSSLYFFSIFYKCRACGKTTRDIKIKIKIIFLLVIFLSIERSQCLKKPFVFALSLCLRALFPHPHTPRLVAYNKYISLCVCMCVVATQQRLLSQVTQFVAPRIRLSFNWMLYLSTAPSHPSFTIDMNVTRHLTTYTKHEKKCLSSPFFFHISNNSVYEIMYEKRNK